MNEKLINLADACVEVHKSSADHKEARMHFRKLIQAAHDMGAGINTDPVVGIRPARANANVVSKSVRDAVQSAVPAKGKPKQPKNLGPAPVATPAPVSTPEQAAKVVSDF